MNADTVQPRPAFFATADDRSRHAATVAIGAVIGLTWSAAQRGWAVQLGGGESRFSWLTLGLVMLPGTLLGGLFGHAADGGRREGSPRLLVWAPLLLLAAMLNPEQSNVMRILAVVMVATGLGAGYALTHFRYSLLTVLGGFGAVGGFATIFAVASSAVPIVTARGAWVCLFGLSLALVLCLACTLPHRRVRPLQRSGSLGHVGIGAMCGLAWACALRSFMAAVVGPESQVTWVDTVIWILLVGTAVGGLLGAAGYRRSMGHPRPALAASPLLFAAVLVPGLLHPTSMFAAGIGGGALGVPLLGMAGAYGLAGKQTWARVACASLFVAGIALWAVVAPDVGGGTFGLNTPRGLWATILFVSLLATLALATAIPLRAPDRLLETPTVVEGDGADALRVRHRLANPWWRSLRDALPSKSFAHRFHSMMRQGDPT